MTVLKYADTAVLLLISVISVIFSVADVFGLLDLVKWLPHLDYPVLLLALFGAMGLHLSVAHLERIRFYESFPGGTERLVRELSAQSQRLIEGVRGVQVVVFSSAAEQELYMAKRFEDAKIEICDLSWKESLSLHSLMPDRAKSQKAYESSIAKAAKRIPYREVFVFSDVRRVEKLQRRLQENADGYSCRYFDTTCKIPRLQFVLIDREEVIFAASAYPKLCAIRQAEIAEICQAYYNAVWEAATPLKEGPKVHHAELSKVLTTAGRKLPK